MSSLLSVANVDMNFDRNNIVNSDTPLNCDVDYKYTLYDTDDKEILIGNNRRKFEFELNANDCTYTLLNMGISQCPGHSMEVCDKTTDNNRENSINSTIFAQRSISP